MYKFNATSHAEALRRANHLCYDAMMVCEGLASANCQLNDMQYNNIAAGAFGLIEFALHAVNDMLDDQESTFSAAHGVELCDRGATHE